MKYTGTLIAVKDIEKSKRFYHDALGLEVAADFGANVTLTGGLVLQTLETWRSFIHTDDVTLKSNAGELYFETEDIDAFYKHLESILASKLDMTRMEQYLAIIADNSGKGIYLDDGTLIGRLLPGIDAGLGRLQKQKRRATI